MLLKHCVTKALTTPVFRVKKYIPNYNIITNESNESLCALFHILAV